MQLSSAFINSPLGDLLAIANESHLLLLEFADSKELEKKVSLIAPWASIHHNSSACHIEHARYPAQSQMSPIVDMTDQASHTSASPKENTILKETQQELSEYFTGNRKTFSVPLLPHGTIFQMEAWKALEQIPYGETRNYLEEATMIANPRAVRAIWGANHANPIVIIIPCHRVIGKSGKLVGYGWGLERKIWLLEHEKRWK